MYSEFAYSSQMQAVLAVVTFIVTFFSMYLIADVILTFCEEGASRLKKCLFAICTGTLLQNIFVYLVFFLGEMNSFAPTMYALITNINPITMLIYYYVTIKIFRLSPVRSIKIMLYICFYWFLSRSLTRMVGSLFIIEQGSRYNYFLDSCRQIALFIIFIFMTFIVKHCIEKYRTEIRFIDTGFFNKTTELIIYFLQTSFLYAVAVIVSTKVPGVFLTNLLQSLIFLLAFLLNFYVDLHKFDRQIISNQTVHISALFKGNEELRGIKHDFNNILHTYSGYLEIHAYDKLKTYHESLIESATRAGVRFDLSELMQDNPALVSLLLEKQDSAAKRNLKMKIDIKCNIDDFYIDMLDFTRVMACLLDNAIEAAEESQDRRIYFTCETKDNSKLVIIANSTASDVDTSNILRYGVTNKPNHDGIGLYTVKNTLDKYENCTFQLKYFNYELSAYIEFRNTNL